MGKRLMFAGAATLLVAAPAIVLARGNGPIETNIAVSGGQTTWSTGGPATTNSKDFRAVNGLPRFQPGNLDYDPGAALHVAVDLRAGKAQLRLRDAGEPTATIDPGSVLLAGKGIRTATFLVIGSNTMTDPVIQWKRVGHARVEAHSVTVDLIGPLD
jgi:hypothetical protein